MKNAPTPDREQQRIERQILAAWKDWPVKRPQNGSSLTTNASKRKNAARKRARAARRKNRA